MILLTAAFPARNLFAAPVAGRDLPLVHRIVIQGCDNPETLKQVRKAIWTREGERQDPDRQKADLRRVYELGIFRRDMTIEVRRDGGGVSLFYQLRRNPLVSSVHVEGNKGIETRKILDAVSLQVGKPYHEGVEQVISRLYGDSGYHNVVFHVTRVPTGEDSVKVNIAVDEGGRTRIRKLAFAGNESLSSVLLGLHLQNKASWGPATRYFNESAFQDDLETVRKIYEGKGFLDARVTRGPFAFAADKSWVDLTINIHEGVRYRVGRIGVSGNTLFSTEAILGPFRPLQGKIYNGENWNRALDALHRQYGDQGYVNAEIKVADHADPGTGLVEINLDIREGRRIHVGQVKVINNVEPDSGNSWVKKAQSHFSPPVRDEVVLRESRLHPGQVYRSFDEVRGKENLEALHIFDSVAIQREKTANPAVEDVTIQVEQGKTGSLIFGAGFGDVEGAFVYTRFIEKNLFGLARDFRSSLLLGSKSFDGEISYLDRFWRGTDTDAQFTVFRRSFERPGRLEQTDTGVTAEFIRPLGDVLSDSLKLRLDNVDFDEKHHDSQIAIDNYLAATIRYGLTRDTRDNRFFPTAGKILSGGIEAGIADSPFIKLDGRFSNDQALGADWVLAENIKAGLIPFQGEDVGYAERFFLGGSDDLRGFRFAGVGPHDKKNTDLPTGGATKLVSQFELRRRFNEHLAGVAFVDTGFLGRKPFEIGEPRMSVGVGARIDLSLASFSVDLGIPVISRSHDDHQLVHFRMTSAF